MFDARARCLLVLASLSFAACGDDGSTDVDATLGGSSTGETSSSNGSTSETSAGDTTSTTDTGTDTGTTDTGTDTGTTGGDNPCVSGTYWMNGNFGSAMMHPGNDCLACHQMNFAAPFVVMAGTVYSESHEVNDCNGVSGVNVTVTGSDGTAHQATTNQAGNFVFQNVSIKLPYTVELAYQGRTRQMVGSQLIMSCNRCHTEAGDMLAPGRILAP